MSSALKWSLFLALTALLSSQSCSANRAHIFSEFVESGPLWPDQPRLPVDPASEPDPDRAYGPSPAGGPYRPTPGDGPGPSPSEGPGAGPTPVLPTSEPVPARRVPQSPKAEIAAEPIPALKNGSNESDVSMNRGGGCGCCPGGPPCVPHPQRNPYYCQPARYSAHPGYGGGFTIYVDDNFMAAVPVSSSWNEKKP